MASIIEIRVNDVLDELRSENCRLKTELLFANQCIRHLLRFKTYLDLLSAKFEDSLDSKLKTQMKGTEEEFELILASRPTPPPQPPPPPAASHTKCVSGRPTTKATSKAGSQRPPKGDKRYEFGCDWIGCDFVTNRKSRLRAHHNYHTGVRPFRCQREGCDKAFVGRESLTTHVKAVHFEREIRCDIVEESARRTKRMSQKTRHVRVLKGEKPFVCDLCIYSARTRQALRQHRLTHADRTLECPLAGCLKLFKNKKQIRAHVLTHASDPLHKCTVDGCSAAFRTYKTLKMHRLRHSNQLPQFRCDWPGCDFSAVYNWMIKRHFLIHTGEKPFQCSWPSCGASFRRNHYLKTHLLRHTGEKAFVCEWEGCGRRFQAKQSLASHVKRHQSVVNQ